MNTRKIVWMIFDCQRWLSMMVNLRCPICDRPRSMNWFNKNILADKVSGE